ncbi:DNA repair exonuclease SbcCD nuclease subunit [Halobacillus dabanensis]|uniref:DNA repair exonuclease SbcCD nuclease subunit n=1 Tax=Halobacillus dabanensis TaxID=240302 RepID=A0A1I3T0X5_HALDA|nr:DNA repair exonuclease [Halobacillus dabanensis]SFJ63207.1 DNA repair exonuclease SbcCD nuclease subunit [Halobacillus dabanensis]
MRDSIRFIHSADLHIDSLFKTKGHLPQELLEQLRASTFEAFDRLIDACIQHQVDFLIITGDLYNEEIRSLKAQVHLRRGFERLQKNGISVYISYGNHDFVKGSKHPIELPNNVHIFTSEHVSYFPFKKNGIVVAHIYGFSYETREVKERKVASYKRVGEAAYHIGMLHGSVETNTEHDVYAPFSIEELKNQGMDYWALGHIHKREVLSEDPPIIYPGNIQGRSRKEAGEKGCYLVENAQGTWNHTFLPLHSFTYETAIVECGHLNSPDQLEKALEEAKKRVEANYTSTMLTITLRTDHSNLREWKLTGYIDEWVEIVNATEDTGSNEWIWIDDVKIIDRPQWNETELLKGHHFTGELLRSIQSLGKKEMEDWLDPLFTHRKMYKYVQSLTDVEKEDALEEAKRMMVEHFMSGEKRQGS